MNELSPEQLNWALTAIDGKQCQTTGEAMIKASLMAHIAATLDAMAAQKNAAALNPNIASKVAAKKAA